MIRDPIGGATNNTANTSHCRAAQERHEVSFWKSQFIHHKLVQCKRLHIVNDPSDSLVKRKPTAKSEWLYPRHRQAEWHLD